ncbi:MAG: hypothetical protein ACJ8GN_26805 [Longimicrobiaceae bacterium]
MLDEAQELELIRSVLVETFPDQCRRVGRANLNDIVRRRGEVRIVPIDASRVDWVVPLTLLASAATILGNCLTIARTIRDSKYNGKAGLIIQVYQSTHLDGVLVSPGHDGGKIIVVNDCNWPLPPELADRLQPADLERLISSLGSRLAAEYDKGPNAYEPK